MFRYPSYVFNLLILFFLNNVMVSFCFVLTSPPLMLCSYLQTFEAALFLEEALRRNST